ncbi:hypothetical protein PAXINDRAFT_168990 [Paxillus involutus ATCC 200175]|uniref:Uncharacterized protein n=1 Tax=Paxillus involutus ATCC 200175 TaxID=664439 RepID=A0A0C9TYU7_PAXIN|nr:hypothetical protein PAXINDRAFT_168990 [Paxillus involutus ATCC 200175]
MLANDSYSTASTSVQLTSIPEDTTGLERIMLAAQGDLQRLLSTFFARPILVKCIYANASPRLRPASPENPITQSRQVHLICANRVLCIATSLVTITSPESERLFLDEKFPIGQTFRQLRRNPRFTLLSVETLIVRGKRELRRTYTLETEGFLTEILEVFPDRDMFTRGEAWLLEEPDLEGTCHARISENKPDWLTVNMGGVVH